MRSSSILKFAALALLGAIVIYAVAFSGIEHFRHRKGPWSVTFQTDDLLRPTLIIKQEALHIEAFAISIDTNLSTALVATNLVFDSPQPTPYPVPFGECVFMDTLFLPGTVAFKIHGHEIELLPRALFIDNREYRWESRATLIVGEENVYRNPVPPP